MPARGDAWAAEVIQRLRYNCGHKLPALWKIKLDAEQAPALETWFAAGRVTLGDLLRSPEDRERQLRVVPLLLLRDGEAVLTPEAGTTLAPNDELLFAGQGSERRELESTLVVASTAAYLLAGQHMPSSWVWRALTRTKTADVGPPEPAAPDTTAGSRARTPAHTPEDRDPESR